MKEGGTCGIGKQIGLHVLQHFASPFGHYLFPVSLPAAAAAAVRSRSSGRSEGVVKPRTRRRGTHSSFAIPVAPS